MKKYRKFKETVQEETKKSSKKTLYTIIIAGLMIFSIAGFTMMENSQQSNSYNGKVFKYQNQKWTTKINNKEFSFYFFPSELTYINSSSTDLIKNAQQVYITFDPNQKYLKDIDLMRFDLSNDLVNLGIYSIQTVTLNNPTYKLSVATCSNATAFVPVIEFRESNETEISLENNCLILKSSTEQDIVKLKDLLLYKILGII